MRVYKLAINRADYDVIIKEVTTEEVRAEVNGEEYTVRIRAIDDLKQESESVPLSSPVATTVSAISLSATPPSVSETPSPKKSSSTYTVKAPIPGQIISINVIAGEKVLKGQKILVLEAMKLENILTSEQDGVVQNVLVKEGEVVNQEQDLVIIT